MPWEHLFMRKAKEVLRLKWGQNLSNRDIATSCQIGVATVHDCLRRAVVPSIRGCA
jgi:DNA-directed RNA polymerase specialized sigma24 family protein